MINLFKRKNNSVNVENTVREEAKTMTHIYDDVFLRREEEALYNIYKNLGEDAQYPDVSSITNYVLLDPCEHVIYMDIKLNIVSRYEATNVFVDTGYKNTEGEPLFLSMVRRNGIFAGEFVGNLEHLGESILALAKSKGNEADVHNNIQFLKENYGNYKSFVDEWELTLDERKEESLGDMSSLFDGIDITSFPEEAPVIEEKIAATAEIEEEVVEITNLPEIRTDKMYVYDYIPNKFYLVQCHTMLGTINFSLVNNHMDVFGKKIPLYSLFVVQYNQGTSLGQLNEDINLRDYNLAIPKRVEDELSEAINHVAKIIRDEYVG